MRASLCRLSDIGLPNGMAWVQTPAVKEPTLLFQKSTGFYGPQCCGLSLKEGGGVEGTVSGPSMLNMTMFFFSTDLATVLTTRYSSNTLIARIPGQTNSTHRSQSVLNVRITL